MGKTEDGPTCILFVLDVNGFISSIFDLSLSELDTSERKEGEFHEGLVRVGSRGASRVGDSLAVDLLGTRDASSHLTSPHCFISAEH